jgi:4-hydroxy-tetrahydrodipicolinate synthase
VLSNEVPADVALMIEAAERSDFQAARAVHHRLMPLMLANFIEANPGPVKAAMAAMGLVEETYRLPLVPPKAESKEKIVGTLKELRLLKGAYA